MCNRCVFTIYYLYEINMLFFIFARGMYNHFTDVVTVQFLKRMILRQLVIFLFIFLKFELFNSTSYIFEFIKLSIYYAVRLISLILGIKIKRFPSKIYVYIELGICFQMLFKVYIKEDDNHYFPIEERVHGAVNMKI